MIGIILVRIGGLRSRLGDRLMTVDQESRSRRLKLVLVEVTEILQDGEVLRIVEIRSAQETEISSLNVNHGILLGNG
jgi:hypothetical protein